MKVTQQELNDARIPLAYRDFCAHLLIPLNKCRAVRSCLAACVLLCKRAVLAITSLLTLRVASPPRLSPPHPHPVQRTFWMPWKCEHERHDYETCEYKEYVP
jgi:NADH dehydrogenase (ubiquinone) 1 beta subcomplex subunit 7